jgi:uncharacterized protein HemY
MKLTTEQLRQLIRKELNRNSINEATTISTETAARKIEKLTDANNHSEAVLELAKLVNDKKYQKIAQSIIDIHEAEGSMPAEIGKYRTKVLESLMKQLKSKVSKEDYDRINSVF